MIIFILIIKYFYNNNQFNFPGVFSDFGRCHFRHFGLLRGKDGEQSEQSIHCKQFF